MPKVSVCMNTARSDYPMSAYENLHMFEFFMHSLREQTFKDFEVVICDVVYERRKDYFKEHPEKFEVKHVPIKPNIWTPRGYTAISTSKNTCLLHAEGEIVVFTDDCSMFPPDYIEKILEKIEPNLGISNKFSNYYGEVRIYNDTRPAGYVLSPWGNVSLYMDKYLEANGYNELFDGSRGLEDCEFSYRANRCGLRWWLLESPPVVFQTHGSDERSLYPTLRRVGSRCCRLIEVLHRGERASLKEANKLPLTDDEIKFLQQCNDKFGDYTCPYTKGKCSWCNIVTAQEKEDIKLYQHPSLIFSLREQKKDVTKAIKDLEEICK